MAYMGGVGGDALEAIYARPPVHYSAYPNAQALWSKIRRVGAPLGRYARKVGLLT